MVEFVLRGFHQFTQRGALGHHAGDFDHTLTVLTDDGRRGEGFLHRGHITHTDTLAHIVVHQDVLDSVDVVTELGGVTHTDVVLVTVLTELRCRVAVEAVAHVSGRSRGVEPVLGQLLAVEDDFQLGCVLVTADHHLGAALHLPHTGSKVGGELVGGVEVVTVELDIDGRLSAHVALTGTDRGGDDFDVLPQQFADTVGNLGDELVTFGFLHQTDVEGEQVCAVLPHQTEGVVLVGHTHGVVDGLDFVRIFLPNLLHDLVAQRLGGLHAGALRQRHCVGKNSVGMTSSNERLARKIMEAKPTTVFRWLTHQRSTLA